MSNLFGPRKTVLQAPEYTPAPSPKIAPYPSKNGIIGEVDEVLKKIDSLEYLELNDQVHSSTRKLSSYQPLPTVRSAKGWKPITLRAPILGGFILISLAIIALLEFLSHRSSGMNGGGLVFASDPDSLPTLTTFLYVPGS